MKNHIPNLFFLLFLILILSCSKIEDRPIKFYQGYVKYYDSDKPISGLLLRVKFYHTVPGVLDESKFITMISTTTDENGKFSFAPQLPAGPYSYSSRVEVLSPGLVQMSRKDPNCEEMIPIQALWTIGQEGQSNNVNFYVDSAAYLQIEFKKVSTTDDTVVYYGSCSNDYYSTLESPSFTVIETFPTLDATYSIERNLIYDVVGSNGIKLNGSKIKLTAGSTTQLSIEY